MKTLNVKCIGFGEDLNKSNFILDILSQRYNIVHSNKPDWVICSVFPDYYAYTKYDCPRIFFSGENIAPDFNVVDYAISFNRMNFEDRYISYPLCLVYHLIGKNGEFIDISNRGLSIDDKNILENKDIFCNFIYSKQSENNIRESFFEQLNSKYKPVASAGKYLNNIPGGNPLAGRHGSDSKIDFQKRCKFTIAFENEQANGYCTEKIVDAFVANTIPIYFGAPYVNEIFNPEAFINVSDFNNYDDVIEYISKLDNDDDAYMKMLTAPIFTDPTLPQKRYNELCEFLHNIFDQEPSNAIRRSRYKYTKDHNDRLYGLSVLTRGRVKRKLYKLFCTVSLDGLKGVFRALKM